MDFFFLKNTHTILHSFTGAMDFNLKMPTMIENSNTPVCRDAGLSGMVTPNPASYALGASVELHVKDLQGCVYTVHQPR